MSDADMKGRAHGYNDDNANGRAFTIDDLVGFAESELARDRRATQRAVKAEHELKELRAARQPINVVFDGPPGPEGPRFVDVETDDGKSVDIGAMQIGAWYKRGDGYWAVRFTELPRATP